MFRLTVGTCHMQTILVLICLAIAIAFMARRFYRTLKQKRECSCACGDCPQAGNCQSVEKLKEIRPGKGGIGE